MTITKSDTVLRVYHQVYIDLVRDPSVLLDNNKRRSSEFSKATLATTRILLLEALANGADEQAPLAIMPVDDASLRYDVMECANTFLRKYHLVSRVGLKYFDNSPQGYIKLKVIKR